jgi:hypothetical protein
MTSVEFERQFTRLTGHFHLPADDSRDTISVDWFKAVEHYHVEALDHAVTELIRTAQDRFWPPLGKILSTIQSRLGRYDRTFGKCNTCNGSSWIEAPSYKANGQVYAALRRCPDCGIPAPELEQHRTEPLSTVEQHEYQAGRYMRSQMPPGLEAKPKPEGEKTEMKIAMERLRIQLFGDAKEGAA